MQSSKPHSQSTPPWSISCLLQRNYFCILQMCHIISPHRLPCIVIWELVFFLLSNCKLPKERIWKLHLILAYPVTPCLISCKSCCSVNICWVNFTLYYAWISFKLSWAVYEQVKVKVSSSYSRAHVKYLHVMEKKKTLFTEINPSKINSIVGSWLFILF